jgi:hypothetical protein
MNKSLKYLATTALVAFASLLAVGCGKEDDKATTPSNYVPLNIQLPQPAYDGTPRGRNPEIPVEPDSKTAEMPKVPPGCKNLSLKKKVTASDQPILGTLEAITDGDKENKSDSPVYVEFGMGTTWVQIDLEKSCAIHAVGIWHYFKDPRVYYGVVVQLSDDPTFKTGVTTIFNNDQKNIAGQGIGKDLGYKESQNGKVVDGKGTKARYVRVYSQGNTVDDNNQFTEVEVWGLE